MASKDFGPVKQFGYIVEDLGAAVASWRDSLGIGPWTVIKNVPLHCEIDGRKSMPMINLALAYQGDVQIELIQQIDDKHSPYRCFIERGHYGLHHMAYLCDDIDGDIQRATEQGLALACDIKMPDGSRYAYFQRADFGEQLFFEFLQATPAMKAMFKAGIAAVADPAQSHTQIIEVDFSEMENS